MIRDLTRCGEQTDNKAMNQTNLRTHRTVRPRNSALIATAAPTDQRQLAGDETYIRVKGKWVYLYRAVDSSGATIDFLPSAC
jgi:transposase, IS6 family